MPHRLTILVLLLALTGCSGSTPSYPERRPPEGFLEQPANIAAGAAIFSSRCAPCHGKPEEGRNPRADFFKPPAPDFSDPSYRHRDPAYLFWRISKGKTVEPYLSKGSVMPAWGPNLNDTEIWQLVAYLRSRSTE